MPGPRLLVPIPLDKSISSTIGLRTICLCQKKVIKFIQFLALPSSLVSTFATRDNGKRFTGSPPLWMEKVLVQVVTNRSASSFPTGGRCDPPCCSPGDTHQSLQTIILVYKEEGLASSVFPWGHKSQGYDPASLFTGQETKPRCSMGTPCVPWSNCVSWGTIPIPQPIPALLGVASSSTLPLIRDVVSAII